MNDCYGIVLPSLKIGGGNRVLLEFLKHESLRNNKTKIFYLDRDGSKFSDPPNEKTIQRVCGDNLLSFIIASILLSFKIRFDKTVDTLIISDPILIIFSFIYANKKIIRFVQSNDILLFDENLKVNQVVISIYKLLFKLSQNYNYYKVLFNSNYSLNSYNSSLPIVGRFNKSHIVNPPVFTLAYDPNFYKPKLLSPNVCIVTNLHPRKGLDKFIHILKHSKVEKVNYYVISQDDIFIPYKNVSVIKPKSDNEYVDILNKCHIILSTSTFEGFGLPLIEGMALGLVPVAIYNKGLEEYNNNNVILFFNDISTYDSQISKIIDDFRSYKKHSELALTAASVFTDSFFYNSIFKKINNI
jgi:glycosyltransferase involved in cell wall biosynthesis